MYDNVHFNQIYAHMFVYVYISMGLGMLCTCMFCSLVLVFV